MDTATRVLIQDKAVCILHSTNTLGKGTHPTILLPARLFNLGITTSREEEKPNSNLL